MLAVDLQSELREKFGFVDFYPAQEEVVKRVLSGQDTLAILATGAGKSLCYQLPAILRDGITVVVSPLVALMKDQVDALAAKGLSATLINSTISGGEQQQRIRRMREGEFKLVYIAPERFRSRSFLQALGQIPSGCLPSTKRTVCHSGVMIFVLTIFGSGRCSKS